MDKMINWAPTVDIIVPCYNVENIIFKCIESLLLQSYDKNKIKIYLVNDGSTDKTGEILDSFSNESQITIIHNNNNMSQAYTRNVGISKGKGEVICFLDSDMIVKTNWVDAHINTLSNKIETPETFEACFNNIVFPEIKLGIANLNTCQKGKFHGMTPRTSPIGWKVI